ncbi:MAG: ribosome biogenesis GTPase Der [Oligoflexia bacterium]|nr:ribosome biogenesis GTPase Der [Oligoflexia bacterium]
MTGTIPSVAIVGRTNVGKSSIFNSIAGKRIALVKDEPGVTRDRAYALVTRFGAPFTLIDTGGLVGEAEGEAQRAARRQCEFAVQEADLILCVFDGMHGVHALDHLVVDFLRQSEKPIIWIANKCEKEDSLSTSSDLFSLGLDEIKRVSAAHNIGIEEVVAEARTRLGLPPPKDEETVEAPSEDHPIRVAVVGRPNVGKSSLVNRLVGEERLATASEAGTTRDSIDVAFRYADQDYVLVDTAGMRRKARIDDDSVEEMSNMRTLRALARCDVAVVVIDATEGIPTEQDCRIAGLIHERGRGMVIVVNKWDAVEKDHRTVKDFERAVYGAFKFAAYAPIVFVSALTGRRCTAVFDKVKEVYEARRVRVKTSDLNRVLARAFEHNSPPGYHGEPVKLFFATQTACEPPSIVLFVNHPKRINFSYQRYLKNILREHFSFLGVDIRLVLRKRTSKSHRGHSPEDSEPDSTEAAVEGVE